MVQINMKFQEMKIEQKILDAIRGMKFETPTEIQEKALPVALSGRDLIAQSMTGSGKTLVFAVPIIQNIEHGKGIQALVIAPTRELANQISQDIIKFSKHKRVEICEVFGGVSIEPQISNLRRAEVVVGTPGRILDHMERGTIFFKNLKILVLDEADRMLDMGFIDDIEDIIRNLPKKRQTMLFSATIPDEIMRIVHRYMNNPDKISAQKHVAKHLLTQYYYDIKGEYKISLIYHLLEKEKPDLAIIFCGTRATTDVVADNLQRLGVEAKAIHGGHQQSKRTKVLEGFHEGRIHVLVATDVAARGLDIKNVTHVFNFDVPKTVDEYTHRIGRTARIGKEGKAISLLAKQDHEAFRKIASRFDIQRVNTEGLKLESIPLYQRRERGGFRRSYNQHEGGRGRDYGRGYGQKRRY